jgi:hypothetical protein
MLKPVSKRNGIFKKICNGNHAKGCRIGGGSSRSPEYQGRVMTSAADGDEGLSLAGLTEI